MFDIIMLRIRPQLSWIFKITHLDCISEVSMSSRFDTEFFDFFETADDHRKNYIKFKQLVSNFLITIIFLSNDCWRSCIKVRSFTLPLEFINFISIFSACVQSVILSFEEHGMGLAVWFLTRLSTTETDIHIT